MKRQIVISLALLALAGLAALVVWARRSGPTGTAQTADSNWKLVVTLPKTNSRAALPDTNTVPKGW